VQCPKCFGLGHNQSECKNRQICPNCPDEHPRFSIKIINPPAEFADPVDPDSSNAEPEYTSTVVQPLMAFLTKTLFDLFPLQRPKIQAILEQTSQAVFSQFKIFIIKIVFI
jgi:hypothetical protein